MRPMLSAQWEARCTQGPLVTVVVPAYNAAPSIKSTVESVRAQTHTALEILVVDDGSKDATSTIIEELMAQEPRIRLLRQENAGVGAARNTAILEARGIYLAPIDADDCWHPRKLELQVARMEEGGEEMGLVYCAHRIVDQRRNRVHPVARIEGEVLRALIYQNFIGPASVPLFRTSAIKEVGLYLTRAQQDGAQGCEDWDLAIRVAKNYSVGYVPDCLVEYRQAPTSMSRNADLMEKSYRFIKGRNQARNPGMPETFFHWSDGNFYSYLASRAYEAGAYGRSLWFVFRAILADPLRLITSTPYKLLLKSLVRSVVGKKLTRPPNLHLGNFPLDAHFERVQKQRLAATLLESR